MLTKAEVKIMVLLVILKVDTPIHLHYMEKSGQDTFQKLFIYFFLLQKNIKKEIFNV